MRCCKKIYNKSRQLSSGISGRMDRQGTPQANQPAGISLVTTLSAPITAPSPMVTPPRMITPQAIQTWLPIVMGVHTRTWKHGRQDRSVPPAPGIEGDGWRLLGKRWDQSLHGHQYGWGRHPGRSDYNYRKNDYRCGYCNRTTVIEKDISHKAYIFTTAA